MNAVDVQQLAARGYSDPEIGDALGVCARTVRRCRARHGIPAGWTAPVAPCGTPGRYTTGCRCTDCRAALAAYQRDYRRRQAYARWAVSDMT